MPASATVVDAAKAWPTRRFSAAAAIAVLALVGGGGGWAAMTQIHGAVIAPGEVRVATNRQVVQHRFGGTVAEILARDGDRVQAGEVLLKLNDTGLRAERAILQRRLDSNHARAARLVAERDESEVLFFDPEFVLRSRDNPDLARVMEGEARIFRARQRTHLEEKAQLQNRIVQIGHEIDGLQNEIDAAGDEQAIIAEEIRVQKGLHERSLVSRRELVQRWLEAARVSREVTRLRSRIAEANSRIAETQISLGRLDAERLEEVVTDLRAVQIEILDLEDEVRKVDDELASVDVEAPVDGIVHASTVHTRGAVIREAESVLSIVPLSEALLVEARIAPASIDDVRQGQTAMVRFPAFNARTTPELAGLVERVSADRMIDDATGDGYYAVEIGIGSAALARLAGRSLLPGMPAEVFMQTKGRSPLSYLVKPLTDHVRRALREQ